MKTVITKSIYFGIGLLTLVVTSGCAEFLKSNNENGSSRAEGKNEPSFFVFRPEPTAPTDLIFDKMTSASTPNFFRKNEELKVYASASFAPGILKDLKKTFKKDRGLLTFVDLRQEPHGYINDRPATWYAPNNWTNSNANSDEAQRREQRLLGDLGIGTSVGGTIVASIETLGSLVRTQEFKYQRLMVVQSVRPVDSEVDKFIEIYRQLTPESWLYLVDYEGAERSVLFTLMVDILKNASTQSLSALKERQAVFAGVPSLFVVPESKSPFYKFAKQEAEFVEKFYQYAKENPGGSPALWGEWIIKN